MGSREIAGSFGETKLVQEGNVGWCHERRLGRVHQGAGFGTDFSANKNNGL
jgi:hypothetical protein